ncbi:NAD-dependent epimerase/dehydratase family protein [Lacticaseibacillus suilingensis]|uniref:NAD-dependent epimerase/dehydratase family protein n=1 Tax=Lacticaseibacillus suilingensis TaxID=2799577 RepID=A0ABW4BF38_9LACO|nr:NAD-dependent epimerase/dehydratase family protein [Lacticaseibacillus suilingensis]
MQKAVVLGGAGHIGSYLVPMLVKRGYAVTSVTRGKHQPYVTDTAWQHVDHLYLDRQQDPAFADKVAAVNADIVIDLISFTLADTKKMVAALKPTKLSHYLFCSSVWAHGRAEILPADPNSMNKHPLDEYGKQKYASELYLKQEFRENGFPATVIMPGQISGPGWTIISPLANENPEVFQKIADNQSITLPNFGMETLHLVHASDVAQLFLKAVMHRQLALGESFHAVGSNSLTLYGYAQAMYRFFDTTPQIKFLQWDAWSKQNAPKDVDKTYYHIARSGQYSIANAQKLLDYQPQYSPIEVAEIAVQSYLDRGIIHHA